MEVEIISTKFIKPSSPTPNHLQNYKLCFFDQIADETHLPLVFFYPPINNINFSAHEEQLEQSLSRILTHVYPMFGRFTEDNSISEAKHGYLRHSLVFFPVNLRGKISLPLKENAFGNYVMDAPILFVPEKNKMELHDFLTLIRNTVQKAIDACAIGSADDIIATVANSYKEIFASKEWGTDNDEVDKCIISSLCKFPMKDADFGRGKPTLVHFGLRNFHSCWMYDAECGSICVQVDLKDSYMSLFECESDIKAFTNGNQKRIQLQPLL